VRPHLEAPTLGNIAQELLFLEEPLKFFMVNAMSYIDYLKTPIGIIEIQASGQGVTQVVFNDSVNTGISTSKITDQCKQELREYFEGKRKQFDLPLDTKGTDFQKSIWDCLHHIPFGCSASYSDLAHQINNPKAVRAVGAANGRNPIAIIVPCHRVIGLNGSLTGYAWGLHRKQWLLKHEAIFISTPTHKD
jgi:methylated-DNA-[protein]-cysteine S-methyltransferase